MKSVKDRLLAKTLVMPSGCWNWQGYIDRQGYGQIGVFVPGKSHMVTHRVHRVAWQEFVGPLPDAPLVLDHICGNPRCIRPGHLRAVTQRENVMSGRTIAAANKAKTHCKNGHQFSLQNTRIDRCGGRHCRACDKQHERAARANGYVKPNRRELKPARRGGR